MESHAVHMARWNGWAAKCTTCGFCGALVPPGASYCLNCETEVGGAARTLADDSDGPSVETCRLHTAAVALADDVAAGAVTDAERSQRAALIAAEALRILDALGEASAIPGLVTRDIAETMVCAFDGFMDAASALRANPPDPAAARERAYRGARYLCYAYAQMEGRLGEEAVA